MSLHAILNIDGGAHGNPGPGAAGVYLTEARTGRVLRAAGFYLGCVTNNQAEYHGLIQGLKMAQMLGVTQLEILSDSQLMVRQINGQYRVKHPGLKPLYEQAMALLAHWPEAWVMRHVYRESNHVADRLAAQAIKAKGDVIVPTQDQDTEAR